MERTPLRSLKGNDLNALREMPAMSPPEKKSTDVNIAEAIQAQLNKMAEVEKIREVERQRALEAMERSDREAKEHAAQLRSTLESLSEMRELQSEAEIARLEAQEARKMKTSLLHRIACQTDMILKLDQDRLAMKEELQLQENQILSMEANIAELATPSSKHDPNAEIQNRRNSETIRNLTDQLSRSETNLLAVHIGAVVDHVLDHVESSINTAQHEDDLLAQLRKLRNEVDSLSEFANWEREEYEARAVTAEGELVVARGKADRLEESLRKSEVESRKFARKIESIRVELVEERRKGQDLTEENRRLKEGQHGLEKDRDAAEAALMELRVQYNTTVETTRREILVKKEDLERERRRAEECLRASEAAQAEMKQLQRNFTDASTRQQAEAQEYSEEEKVRARQTLQELAEVKKRLATADAELRKANFDNRILLSENETLKVKAELAVGGGSGGGIYLDSAMKSTSSTSTSSEEIENELIRLREETEQYKAFARRYKEKVDLRLREMSTWSDTIKTEVKKHWGQLSNMPELTPLLRAIMARRDHPAKIGRAHV